jgi:glycerol kinase
LILAIDQGTTGTTCLVVGDELVPLGRGYREIQQHFPRPGWVEHDPEEMWESVLTAAGAALRDAGLQASDLSAIGITNQRETTLLWERRSGRPVQRAIVWQDRRTAERCRELPADLLRERTGLEPDPYFSATKLEWLLDHSGVRSAGLAFGTVDTWLLWKLTGGSAHVTDVTNASRTLLLSLEALEWDDELLGLFGVERTLLPEIRPSAEVVAEGELLGATLPIAGIAGDQQAALFYQGQSKATYGTGNFVLALSDRRAPTGIVRTAAALVDRPEYALEGSIFVTGAAVQGLRDGLGLLAGAAESEELARSLDANDGVYFVPALTGLGAPHWMPEARGLICGITRGTRREHLVRAALEAIAYQTRDVLDAMALGLDVLRADGGATENGFLMQFQADLLGIPVEVAAERETTALGAAALAAIGIGLWDREEVARLWRGGTRYEPEMTRSDADRLHEEWHAAVRRAGA